MGLLGNILKKGISDVSSNVTSSIGKGIGKGISDGIGNALGKAVESAVRPAADKLANEAAADINQTADTLAKGAQAGRESRSALGDALENLAKAAEEYNKANGVSTGSSKSIYYEFDESDTRSAEEKISAVLAEEFPQYEVRKYVSPTTIGGTGKFLDYTFGIYDAGAPKLFIMLVGKATCGSRIYRWSKEQAAKAGVTLINFVEHYPNRPEYIKERLHQYI
ncbi:MAG: hypothetical protein MJ059_08580 [Lachnospiraceae bacterium]|nr:hypothetical protein [Lachnospiraceae bacterium]